MATLTDSTRITPEVEIRRESIYRITNYIAATLSLFVALSAILFQDNLTAWGVKTFLIIIGSTLISLALALKFKDVRVYLFHYLLLLALPLLSTDKFIKPWVSEGLLAATFVIFVSFFENLLISLGAILVAIAAQILAATGNFPGVSDVKDLGLFHTFYSSIWMVIAGIGSNLTTKFWASNSKNIDLQLQSLEESVAKANIEGAQLNLKDHHNLRLHGTLLNTIIYFLGDSARITSKKYLASTLENDLSLVESENIPTDFKTLIAEMRSSKLISDLDVEISFAGDLNLSSDLKEIISEILREILLNISKHSSCKNAQIIIKQSANKNLELNVTERFGVGSNLSRERDSALASKSLQRILERVNAAQSINIYENNLIRNIHMQKPKTSLDILQNIKELRVLGIESFGRAIAIMFNIFGWFVLVGLIAEGRPIWAISLTFLQNIFFSLTLYLKSSRSLTFGWLATFFSLIFQPILLLDQTGCSSFNYLAWTANIWLGAIFYSALLIRNSWIRYLPSTLLIIESTFIPLLFPSGCQDILLGTTPAFFIIFSVAIYIGRVRQRYFASDSYIKSQYQEIVSAYQEVGNSTTFERQQILNEVKEFINSLKQDDLDESFTREKLEYFNLYMRAFLNSSEYFNLFFVRTIFAFVRDELRNGRKINFKIIGRPYSSEEIYANLRKELDETLIKFPERELELTLLSTDDSKIIFEHGSKKAELALN